MSEGTVLPAVAISEIIAYCDWLNFISARRIFTMLMWRANSRFPSSFPPYWSGKLWNIFLDVLHFFINILFGVFWTFLHLLVQVNILFPIWIDWSFLFPASYFNPNGRSVINLCDARLFTVERDLPMNIPYPNSTDALIVQSVMSDHCYALPYC